MVYKALTKLTWVGGVLYLRVPQKLRVDSTFPFKTKDRICMEIIDGLLVVRAATEDEFPIDTSKQRFKNSDSQSQSQQDKGSEE